MAQASPPPPSTTPPPGFPIDGGVLFSAIAALFYGVKSIVSPKKND
ncbi:hypothetical protein VOI54_04195 [Tamlana sp. 2201CG12-4]|nr:hypothetical protein [Tamlana sp. 2201CG12-4]MEC3906205.1 hypothetical protein [Tamlana sp. 2201CG12-4]